MNKGLQAFRKICKNLNSYEFTDEYKKNKKLVEKELKESEETKALCEILRTILTDLTSKALICI